MKYTITNDGDSKYVTVGSFQLMLHEDVIEVFSDGFLVEAIEYGLVMPTKADKKEILHEAIIKYDELKDCPF